MTLRLLTLLFTLALTTPSVSAGVATADWRSARPDAIVDLRTNAGAQLVGGTWLTREATISEIDHRAPGPDLKASGSPTRTHDLSPRAGGIDFDDCEWDVAEPTSLEQRRGTGRLSAVWYRINVVVPDKVAMFDTTGSTAVLEVVVDDYSEVWVNRKLPQVLGSTSGVAGGWNAPNRVVLGRGVKPGDAFQIAILGINGPLSDVPANFVWIRSATIQFYSPQRAGEPAKLEIVRLDPALDAVVSPDATLEKLATGLGFAEGPVWVGDENDGYLLFSDPNENKIYRLSGDGELSVFRPNSGYTGFDIARYRQPGSNGLALDSEGRLTICEHGNRRVTRLETNGTVTVLADRFEGKRLNSPNDLVYGSDDTVYFTDPYFGLPGLEQDPAKELPFSGVYRLKGGELKLLTAALRGPNGIALSPDGKHLYVGNWDEARKIVMRYDVTDDGVANGTVFADLTHSPGDEAIDGVKVDPSGNVFVSGPGGLWIFSPEGTALGRLTTPELPANFAWVKPSRTSLILAARSSVYRLNLRPGK